MGLGRVGRIVRVGRGGGVVTERTVGGYRGLGGESMKVAGSNFGGTELQQQVSCFSTLTT
jgi:hypothetical protein